MLMTTLGPGSNTNVHLLPVITAVKIEWRHAACIVQSFTTNWRSLWLNTTLTALRRSERLFFTTENLPLLPLIWQCRNLQYKQVEFQQSDQFKVPLRPGLWLLLWQRHWYDGEEVPARFRQYQPGDWQTNRRDREEEKTPLRHAKLQERKEKCLVIIVWGTRRFDGDYGVGLYCWHWIRL